MRTFLFFILLGVVPLRVQSQDISDLRKQFNDFRQETQNQYTQFRDQCNAEYAQFLREAWQEFNELPGIKRPQDQQRLPQILIDRLEGKGGVISFQTIAPADIEVACSEIVTAPSTASAARQPQPLVDLHEIPPTITSSVGTSSPLRSSARRGGLTFEFYGTQMSVHTGHIGKKLSIPNMEEETVASAWETCSKRQYNELISDCLKLRDDYHLCDWAYLQMLKILSESYLGSSTNESTFLTAFIYCQSGYRIRLGRANGKLILLFSSEHVIYEQPHYNIEGKYFYPFGQDGSLGKIQICCYPFPHEQPMSLLIPEVPHLTQDVQQIRTIQSRDYPEFNVQVAVNKNLLQFFEHYPTSNLNDNFLTRWAMYACTPMDEEVKRQLYPSLRRCLEGLSEREAVCRLLSLLQSGLTYKYDEDVWGYDRAFFAEETLFYPYADCEDRSILFTRLVRDVLGLKAVLIFYPNHLAAAVHFNEEVTGDYVLVDDERYMICDPTNYVPAPGVTMEGKDNTTAKIILLDN